MSKLLQIYFIISFSLFTSVIAKLYTASHSFFEAYVAIFEKKNYFIVVLNFLIAIGIMFIIFIQNYFMGTFQETEYKQATNELFGFVASIFLMVYYLDLEFVTFNFVMLIFCRYLICLINVRVKGFTINFENASAKSHRRLILLQFSLFLYCFSHFINNLKKYNENAFNVTLMNQYFLCCNFLFESIISQMIIISDDQGGNSITAYYNRQKLSYYGSIFSVAINILTGFIILKSRIRNKVIFILISIYDPLNETFKKINNYRKWKKFCTDLNMNLLSPTDEELQEHDTCIICRMKLTKNYAKKLPCGHIFHLDCMIVWFGSRQICPLCGADIHELLKGINIDHHHHHHDHDILDEENNNEVNNYIDDLDGVQFNYADFENNANDTVDNSDNHNHGYKRHRSHKHDPQPQNDAVETSYSFSDFANLDDIDDSQQNQAQNIDVNQFDYIYNPNIDNPNQENTNRNNNNQNITNEINNNNQNNTPPDNSNAELAEELRQTKLLLKEFEDRVKYLEARMQNKDDNE